MGEIEILNERPLTIAEVKGMLAEIKKNVELGFRANKTTEYGEIFTKRKPKEVEEIRKKLEELNILRLRDKAMTKLIDLNPSDQESAKAILAAESIVVKQEELSKILECLK